MRLTFLSALNSFSGYGSHLINLVEQFEARGIHCSIRSSRTDTGLAKIPGHIQAKLVHGPQPEPWEILLHLPDMFPTPGKKTVYMTTTESTRLPKRNVDILNHAELVIVPSEWCASCLSASGVDSPIRVVPLGVDPKLFNYRPMTKGKPFVFGCGGRLMNGPSRKGIQHLIRLFQSAFSGDDVRLRVKCQPDCPIFAPADSRIELVKSYLPDKALADYYADVHCWISFATGAWELMPHQAMGVGRPVLGIDFAGMAEYLTDEASYIVPHHLVPAGDKWKGQGCWGAPEDVDVVRSLQWIAKNFDDVQARGDLSHKRAMQFTWSSSADRLLDVLREFGVVDKPTPSVRPPKPKCFIQLGRYGDIINILPVIREEHCLGRKPVLMVAEPYRDLLDGVSFCNPMVFKGAFEEVQAAWSYASAVYPEVCVTQVYGKDYSITRGLNFNRDSWRLAGYLDKFEDLPLVFDRRDFQREKALYDRTVASIADKSLPLVLIAIEGHSSPFPHAEALMSHLEGLGVNLVPLPKAERLYDLLGLFDRASLVITSDSSPLHLLAASNTPAIAFTAVLPSPWHGTAPRGRISLKMPYDAVPAQLGVIGETVLASPKGPRLIHVYSDYPATGDSHRRHELARRTWGIVYAQDRWVSARVCDPSLPRLFPDDRRKLPFISDMIDQGVIQSLSDDEVIVLTNTDTCLSPATSQEIRKAMAKHQAVFCYRKDFPRLDQPLSVSEIAQGQPYQGCDLFAFTVGWWKAHRGEFPDMVAGAEGWDWTLRELIRKHRGGQVENLAYHELHEQEWFIHRFDFSSQRHNHALAKKFLTALGVYAGELEG